MYGRTEECPSLARSNHRKVDVRLPGKGNSNSYGARPLHLIITMIKWIRKTDEVSSSGAIEPMMVESGAQVLAGTGQAHCSEVRKVFGFRARA